MSLNLIIFAKQLNWNMKNAKTTRSWKGIAYDKVKWHYGRNFPREELPRENAATHIGMFLAWAIKHNLISEFLNKEAKKEVEEVLQRKITGAQFLINVCDESFTDEDLNDEGNEFAKYYYESNKYFQDYSEILGSNLPSLYHVEDSWKNYEKIEQRIGQRYQEWKKKAKA